MWLILLGVACSKSSEDELLMKDVHDRSINSSIAALSYGDEVFYPTNQKDENLVMPVSRPTFPGEFVAIPAGLSIDRKTGVIDIQNSEPGQAYKIFYVNSQGILKDSVRIIISGVGYQDGIYNLESISTEFGRSAYPTYNADFRLPESIVNNFSASDEDDESELNNASRKLKLNKFTGEVDLKSTVDNGFFGHNPSNGSRDEVIIRYRIADKSARRMNKIPLRLYYFKSETEVPQDLKEILEERAFINDRVNKMPSSIGRNVADPDGTGDQTEEGATEASLSEYNKPVRPPLIIVVG
jgi:hypothetical protein